MRIIHEALGITAIQYSDETLDRVLVQIFTNLTLQDSVTVYPVVEDGTFYKLGEQTLSSEEINANGIKITAFRDADCVSLELIKA